MLLLATCEEDRGRPNLSPDLLRHFTTTFRVPTSSNKERSDFFSDLIADAGLPPPEDVLRVTASLGGVKTRARASKVKKQGSGFLPQKSVLDGVASDLTAAELDSLDRYEKATLRKLTMYLRTVLNTLERDRKFKEFVELPNREELPEYYVEIKNPTSLETMHEANDDGKYGECQRRTLSMLLHFKCTNVTFVVATHQLFLDDIDIMADNAIQFNPDIPDDGEPNTKTVRAFNKRIRRAAAALRDDAYNLIENAEEDHADLLRECEEIARSRERRYQAKTEVHHPASLTKERVSGDESDGSREENGAVARDSADEAGPAQMAESSSIVSEGAELLASAAEAEAAAAPPRELTNLEALTETHETLVEGTKDWSLAALTKLLSRLRHVQYEHREECDKEVVARALLDCLEAE